MSRTLRCTWPRRMLGALSLGLLRWVSTAHRRSSRNRSASSDPVGTWRAGRPVSLLFDEVELVSSIVYDSVCEGYFAVCSQDGGGRAVGYLQSPMKAPPSVSHRQMSKRMQLRSATELTRDCRGWLRIAAVIECWFGVPVRSIRAESACRRWSLGVRHDLGRRLLNNALPIFLSEGQMKRASVASA